MKYDVHRKSWKDIKFPLRQEFFQKVDSHDVHKELQRRKKKIDEIYTKYCYKCIAINYIRSENGKQRGNTV